MYNMYTLKTYSDSVYFMTSQERYPFHAIHASLIYAGRKSSRHTYLNEYRALCAFDQAEFRVFGVLRDKLSRSTFGFKRHNYLFFRCC